MLFQVQVNFSIIWEDRLAYIRLYASLQGITSQLQGNNIMLNRRIRGGMTDHETRSGHNNA